MKRYGLAASSVTIACLAVAMAGLPPTASADDGGASPSPAVAPADDPTSTDTATAEPNQPPVAKPDSATVEAGRSVTIKPLANDTDADDDPLTVDDADTLGERVTFTASTITFKARTSDQGAQTFGYTISDGTDTATSTVTVTVKPARAVRIRLA